MNERSWRRGKGRSEGSRVIMERGGVTHGKCIRIEKSEAVLGDSQSRRGDAVCQTDASLLDAYHWRVKEYNLRRKGIEQV